jgi:hypothetical protein
LPDLIDGGTVALSADDWDRLDRMFAKVEARMDAHVSRLEGQHNLQWKHIAKLSEEVAVMEAKPCPDVATHINLAHDPAKKAGFIASMLGIMATLAAGVSWFVSHLTRNGGDKP